MATTRLPIRSICCLVAKCRPAHFHLPYSTEIKHTLLTLPYLVLRTDRTEDTVSSSGNLNNTAARHKIVVLGAAKVGKSSLITQFLYNSFSTKYKRTVEEMHHGDFNVAGVRLTLDILDTSGSYEFPAMRALSMSSADAFILVYDISDADSFVEVRTLRDQIHETKASTAVPIVVVGNKVDLAETGARQVGCSCLFDSLVWLCKITL